MRLEESPPTDGRVGGWAVWLLHGDALDIGNDGTFIRLHTFYVRDKPIASNYTLQHVANLVDVTCIQEFLFRNYE